VADLRQREPDREVEFIIHPNLNVLGDADLLNSALFNLFDNSWKFTGKHQAARIEFGEVEKDGELVFFVRDDGAGFDMASSDRLFQAFQRLHSSSEFAGSGVGLATVARIVKRHGGRLWAEGALERGATFYFSLNPERRRVGEGD